MHSKTLTVITYYHANEKLLSRCIKGLVQQTFQDFNWLLLAHTPITETIEHPYTEILLPTSVTNKSEAYNYILPKIDTVYIAYNDGDDTSLPHRFEDQINYLDIHTEISICSGACVVNDDQPGWPIYSDHDDIVAFLLLNNPVVNPAVMMRNLKGVWGQTIAYNPAYIRAQDYDFWFQCMKNKLLFHGINHPLISYYVPEHRPENDTQEDFAITIRQHIWQQAGISIHPNFREAFNDFCIIRKMPEKTLLQLMNHLKKKHFKKPFQNGNLIISNYLNTYITNHQMRENELLLNYVSLFRKGYLLRQVLEK
ncbi:MAG: glycosyltransferase [Bacteroidota bacterium]